MTLQIAIASNVTVLVWDISVYCGKAAYRPTHLHMILCLDFCICEYFEKFTKLVT